ncbi:MAG: alpha/beta fold hydrolase [Bacteroidota bacterium]
MKKRLFVFLNRFFPSVAANMITQIMASPRVRPLKDFEEEVLEKAHKERVLYQQFEVQKYSWGKPSRPKVLMIHGWEGRAGNFGGLVETLVQKGYHVIAYDAPAHGKSSRGKTSMFQALSFVSEMIGAHQPEILISHSFGSVCAAFSLLDHPNLMIKQWYMVTTPNNFKDRIGEMSQKFGLTSATQNHLIKLLEEGTPVSMDEMNMKYVGEKITNLQEGIIIHSTSDRILPISKARKTQKDLPNTEMVELEGLGHYGILWSDQLLEVLQARLKDPVYS